MKRNIRIYWSDGSITTIHNILAFKKLDPDTYMVQFDDYSWEEISVVSYVEWM